MNKKIIIQAQDGNTLFKGNILDIPIKEAYIIEKSIELFDDDDPCIIHKSYVIKNIVDDLLTELSNYDKTELKLNEINLKLDHFDFPTDAVICIGG